MICLCLIDWIASQFGMKGTSTTNSKSSSWSTSCPSDLYSNSQAATIGKKKCLINRTNSLYRFINYFVLYISNFTKDFLHNSIQKGIKLHQQESREIGIIYTANN